MAHLPIRMGNDDYDTNAELIGYEVYCDGCDKLMGSCNADEEPEKLVLCTSCGPHCCTSDTLKEAAGHGDEDAQEELNRRSVRTNADGSASFVGEVKLPW